MRREKHSVWRVMDMENDAPLYEGSAKDAFEVYEEAVIAGISVVILPKDRRDK